MTFERKNKIIKNKIKKTIYGNSCEKILIKWYNKRTGEDLQINNPKNFNQFMQYLKIYDNKEYKRDLSDKLKMRDYVKEKIGEKYLPKLLGDYSSFDEINFSALPNQFVLKCNHGSGMNKIIKKKKEMNLKEIKSDFDYWMKINYCYYNGYEPQYREIKPRILCEEYLGDNLTDIQLWCAKGNILFISYIRSPHGENEKKSFDENWNELDFVTSKPTIDDVIPKPQALEQLIKIGKEVSKDMKFIRLDFYLIGNETKISEFTFSPNAGACNWEPKSANEKLFTKIKELNGGVL